MKKNSSNINRKRRVFKYLNNNKYIGRYYAKSPINAASKVCTRIHKKPENKNSSQLNITIKECTRGSKRNVYKYTCRREKLINPRVIIVNRGNHKAAITFSYKNHICRHK